MKLHLHEACAHEGFTKLNNWIREGCFPGVPSTLAQVPDSSCSICNFGKAWHRSHKSHVGQIGSNHQRPGEGVSSDGMEAGTLRAFLYNQGITDNQKIQIRIFLGRSLLQSGLLYFP